MRAIECPNCGAPATNHQNCNFCGSLLVRFADKGIDLSTTSYLNNNAVLPGLIKELEKNLNLQQSDNGVITEVYMDDKMIGSIQSSKTLTGFNGDYFPDAETPSLATEFAFGISDSDDPDSKIECARQEKFEHLQSYPLFESSADKFYDTTVYQYVINFGQDVEGAARLFSEVANKVYDCPLNRPLLYNTKTYDPTPVNININEDKKEEGNIDWKKWIWIGVAIVGGLIYLFS